MKSYNRLKIGNRAKIPKGNPETLSEIEDASLYRDDIKKVCQGFDCGIPIPGTWNWYRQYGNFCQRCGIESEARAKSKKYKTGREFGLRD